MGNWGCNLWISGPVTPLISPAWANMWKVLPSLFARSKSGYTMARDEHPWALIEKPRQNSTVGEHRVNGSLFKGVEHAHGGDLGERWNAEEIGGGVLHQGIIYFCSFIPWFFTFLPWDSSPSFTTWDRLPLALRNSPPAIRNSEFRCFYFKCMCTLLGITNDILQFSSTRVRWFLQGCKKAISQTAQLWQPCKL